MASMKYYYIYRLENDIHLFIEDGEWFHYHIRDNKIIQKEPWVIGINLVKNIRGLIKLPLPENYSILSLIPVEIYL